MNLIGIKTYISDLSSPYYYWQIFLDPLTWILVERDLPTNHLCLSLNRQFPENLLFGQAIFSMKTFLDNNQIFSYQTIFCDMAEV